MTLNRTSGMALAAITFVALLLRFHFDIDGVLDSDTLNFGLAAFRFDVLEHQPHPPGYPGYVAFLKLIHALAPGLGPADVAKWGSRIAGAATVPAAYWCAMQLCDRARPDAPRLALFAAAFAALHPLLWYYGSDGQSHAAEACATLLLVGACAKARRSERPSRLALVAILYGLLGSLRITVALFNLPFVLWMLWRRPLRDWALAALCAALGIVAWFVPLVIASGGWARYQLATAGLMGKFFDTYSIFGSRASVTLVAFNLNAALWALLWAAIPVVAWARVAADWKRAWLVTVSASVAFYALIYAAEPGYFTGVAALTCLVPALWPREIGRSLGLRRIAALALGPAALLLGPATVPLLGLPGQTWAPTFAHAVQVEQLAKRFRAVVCGAAGGAPALVLTDDPMTTHTRGLPVDCPGLTLGVAVRGHRLDPSASGVTFYDEQGLYSTSGSSDAVVVRRAVAKVILVPNVKDALSRAVRSQALCVPTEWAPNDVARARGETALVWDAKCLPHLQLVGRSIRVTPL